MNTTQTSTPSWLRPALGFLVAALLLAAPASGADKPARSPFGVTTQIYHGWGVLVLRAPEADATAIVVPSIGGRIVHYSVHGENILWENTNTFGQTLATSTNAPNFGGYQLDIGPELRAPRIPRHDPLWLAPHTASILRDYTVRLTSPPDPTTGV
ncbi:MAG: hypothetical protein HY300_15665, partial [Verrucomicrobia bacterium]|nr:hypothetical protein [Verrucomicrobiota bacterium]